MESPSSEFARPNPKQVRLAAAIRRARMLKIYIFIGVLGSLGAITWLGIYLYHRPPREMPGRAFADQGRQHVALDYVYQYNANPPVSGPHFGTPADWGVYDKELSDLVAIHNLEHGGIWISYKHGIPDDVKNKFEAFYKKFGTKIIVTPRAKNDTDIALAAWTHLDAFNVADYSDERVDKFIRSYRNRGPEFIPDMPIGNR